MCGYKEDEDDDEAGGRLTGTEFADIDLTELEWADYDERSNESTMISGKWLFGLVAYNYWIKSVSWEYSCVEEYFIKF